MLLSLCIDASKLQILKLNLQYSMCVLHANYKHPILQTTYHNSQQPKHL